MPFMNSRQANRYFGRNCTFFYGDSVIIYQQNNPENLLTFLNEIRNVTRDRFGISFEGDFRLEVNNLHQRIDLECVAYPGGRSTIIGIPTVSQKIEVEQVEADLSYILEYIVQNNCLPLTPIRNTHYWTTPPNINDALPSDHYYRSIEILPTMPLPTMPMPNIGLAEYYSNPRTWASNV